LELALDSFLRSLPGQRDRCLGKPCAELGLALGLL